MRASGHPPGEPEHVLYKAAACIEVPVGRHGMVQTELLHRATRKGSGARVVHARRGARQVGIRQPTSSAAHAKETIAGRRAPVAYTGSKPRNRLRAGRARAMPSGPVSVTRRR